MLSYTVFIETVNMHFPIKKITKNGHHVNTRCPFCGDSKKNSRKMRFNIEFESSNHKYVGSTIFKCFNCGESGSFTKLYAYLNHLDEDTAKSIIYSYNPKDIKLRINNQKKNECTKIEEKKYIFDYILKDCIQEGIESKSMVINQYLEILKTFRKERMIPDDFPLYFAIKGDFKGRVIIPVFENNHLIYFQARSLDPNADRKYINPIAEKEFVIFNREKFDRINPIMIVEGLIDAISLGNNATTILGASLSDDFVERLLTFNTDLIAVFDNDERGVKELTKFIYTSNYSNRIKYFIMPTEYNGFKDINELYCMKFKNINNLYNFVLENSYSKTKASVILKLGR